MLSREVDVVVVGAGTAGCVVASRLSEDATCRVALVEAGGSDARPDVRIPGASALLHRSSADWKFYTEPQAKLNDRRLYYPRGKVVGGCGSTNTLIYMRGERQDFDDWNVPGWRADDVMPFFRRAEGFRFEVDAKEQGTEGPLPIAHAPYRHPVSEVFVAAGEAAGLPRNEDFNAGSLEGVGFYQLNIASGIRQSTARAYLAKARWRSNLEVVTGAMTETLLFDGKRCVGVRIRRGRTVEELRARREVIVSAGAIGSPALLMYSGIGPAEHLRDMGRPVVLDQPLVGARLQDHPLLPIADRGGSRTGNTTAFDVGPALQYLALRKGPLLVPYPAAGGFARTGTSSRPDIQFHFAPAWSNNLYDVKHMPPEDGYMLCVTVCRPRSRGSVRLGGSRTDDPPRIDPAFFTDEDDLDTMIRGFELAQKILSAAPFDAIRKGPALPPERLHDPDAIARYVRLACETTYHPIGTCRMGADASDSVVDPSLKVRGIDGLRVIDASVMPAITTGNTNAPTIMIAERGSDMIQRG